VTLSSDLEAGSTIMSDSTRVHIVFGAYGGIGSALARRLAHSGVQLAVSGRDSDRLEVLADELGAWAVPADASSSTKSKMRWPESWNVSVGSTG
jgi:NADP-dependent 3-hydroxy acid dehydrogenase YdfG